MSCLRWRAYLVAAVAAATVLAPGCDSAPSLVPVTGTLTLDGKPLGDVEVAFVPDPEKGTKGESGTGATDAQGRFTVRPGRTGGTGLAPGFYRVTVTDLSGVADLTAPPTGSLGTGVGAPKPASPGRPRVPALYSDPARTPLRDVEVKAGAPPFVLDVKTTAR